MKNDLPQAPGGRTLAGQLREKRTKKNNSIELCFRVSEEFSIGNSEVFDISMEKSHDFLVFLIFSHITIVSLSYEAKNSS